MYVHTPHLQVDALGESTYGSMQLLKQLRSDGVVPLLGLQNLDDILHVPVEEVKHTVNVRSGPMTPPRLRHS